jgi:hypothetical protein
MTFPASTQIKMDALTEVWRTANRLKSDMQRRRDTLANKNVSGQWILAMISNLTAAINTFESNASVPGIGDYVKDQYEDLSINVLTEFSNMKNATQDVKDWIVNNLPTDSNGYLIIRSLDTNGEIVEREFTPTQTQILRDKIDTLIATIG